MAKRLLKGILPKSVHGFLNFIWHHYFDGYSVKSYSQEGEDIVLRNIFANKSPGYYVDVGAHHPMRFSNTYHFYKHGWQGINIEAMPGSVKVFKKYRPRDINIEKAISNKMGPLTYYIFNEPALNGFSDKIWTQDEGSQDYFVTRKIELETCTLKEILDKCLPPEQQIDFLSIDVEGMEYEVLQSNDWLKYRPKVVVVEIRKLSFEDILKSMAHSLLASEHYMIFAKTGNTVIYKLATISF